MEISFCYHKIGEPSDVFLDFVSYENFRSHLRFHRLHKATNLLLRKGSNRSNRDVWSFDDGYANIQTVVQLLVEKKIEVIIFVNMHNVIKQEFFYWDSLAVIFTNMPNKLNELFPSLTKESTSLYEYIRFVSQLEHEQRLRLSARLSEIVFHSDFGSYFVANLRPLNLTELKELSKNPYVSIGNHSFSHPSFGFEGVDFDKEILLNHRLIVESFGIEPKVFAFPFGTQNDKSMKAEDYLVGLDYKRAFSTIGKPHSTLDNPMYEPRLVIGNWSGRKYIYKIFRMVISARVNWLLHQSIR